MGLLDEPRTPATGPATAAPDSSTVALCGSLLAWEQSLAALQQVANELPSLRERDRATRHIDAVATIIRRNLNQAVKGITS